MRPVSRMAISVVLVLIFTVSLFGCTKKTSSNVQITTDNDLEGKLVITVLDKTTKKPVGDAKIVLIGYDNKYKTDEKGTTPEITLKINKDLYKKYGGELWKKAPSGATSILVSKEGYKDSVIFNKAVYPGSASNRVNVELVKLAKTDKQKFTTNFEPPHEVWTQELISFCKNIKDNNEGSGTSKATINIKDQNSKVVEGAAIIIPELGIKGITDKSGKIVLKPNSDKEVFDAYPVKKDYMEYTLVAMKDGYVSEVLFNAAIYKEKDNVINIKLKPLKDKVQSEFETSYQPFDDVWVQKLIDNYKKSSAE